MCGIGMARFNGPVHRSLLVKMILETEQRGQDAFGITCIHKEHGMVSFKVPKRASEAVELPGFHSLLEASQWEDTFIWNCRAQPLTETSSFDDRSVQPIHSEGLVISHNGVVANDAELVREHELKPHTDLDSEIPGLLFRKTKSIPETFTLCSGGFAYIMYDQETRDVHLVKDFKTLVFGADANVGVVFAISEEASAKKLFGKKLPQQWKQMDPFTHITLHQDNRFSTEPIATKIISRLPEQRDLVLVCSSGGVDSTTAAYLIKKVWKKDVVLCHIDLGQKSELGEAFAVRALARDLECEVKYIDMRWLGALGASVLTSNAMDVPVAQRQNLKSTICWTPARNLSMVAGLMSVAESMGAKYVTAGWTLEEEGSYPDNSILFFQKFNELSDYGTLMRPKLVMPLERLMKTEIVRLGTHLGVPYEKTYSCDNRPEGGQACGFCGACTLRRMAFQKSGIEDKTEYVGDYKSLYLPPWVHEQIRVSDRDISEILNRVVTP